MIDVRPFARLGQANHGWLDAKHHFSFAHYFDPQRMNWGKLRVWNDDTIAPHTGFDTHPHKDMEIITYVRQGAITHKDSLGNTGRTEASDVQVMSAGTGIFHSEYNHEDIPTQIFQIWILPREQGHKPSWGTKRFPQAERAGHFSVLASGYAEDKEALPLHADGRVLGITLSEGQSVEYTLPKGMVAYLVPAMGSVKIDDDVITQRSGAALSEAKTYKIEAFEKAELILVETAL